MMTALFIVLLGLFLAGTLPMGTQARECEAVPEYEGANSLTIANPEQLRAFDNCTTINGSFGIATVFEGEFVLNSVTEITGYVHLDDSWSPPTGVSAVEMLNLQSLQSLRLSTARSLSRLQLPMLAEIKEDMDVAFVPEGAWFDLTALNQAGTISVRGLQTNASFPSLETVTGMITLHTDPRYGENTNSTPFDIHLPVLKETGNLSVYGQIRNLSIPRLEAIYSDDFTIPSGLIVRADSTEFVGVSLPSLREIYGGLDISGYLPQVNLPNLRQTNADIRINATALNYTGTWFSAAIEQMGNLYVSGDIELIDLLYITNATSIDILSYSKIHCTRNLIETHRKLYGQFEPFFCDELSMADAGENPYTFYKLPPSLAASATPTPSPSFSPTPTPTPASGSGGGLSSGGKTAIIVVALVVGCFLIGGSIVLRWKRKHRKLMKKVPSTSHVRLGPIQTRAGPYSGVVSSGNRTTSGDAVASTPAAAPQYSASEAPPPYSREPPSAT
ncbi:uncharacterized protein BDV14DRAFT_180134 [Aspergillus stella-maris]|uniref:uncharacterized protein n=1 Tax=Aspergillus stella-maris TaxID=1810926 RepID=UPI003CCCF56D